MSKTTHWGDIIPNPEKEQIPDISSDIERSMNNFFLHEFEVNDDHTPKNEKIEVPPLNPLVMYAISLHKHANNIAEKIKLYESSKKLEKTEFQMPEKSQVASENKLNYSVGDFKEFAMGNEVQIVDLSKTVVRQILIKCISTLFAHIGYETSEQSALDVLVDALQEFYKKITHHVKIATEDSDERQFCGFPNVIERVLTEMGMGGVKALDDYYRYQIINYNNVLENRCKELYEEYQSLSIPKSPSPVDKINKVVRVKVEEEDIVEVENPEVHFSTIDGDVSFSILETGYQLLNSLEAETNLQSLGEAVEDMAVSESPGITEDVSHLSPYNKKKRFK